LNWLAHVFLSEPSLDFRLGNLLADVVRGPQLEKMSPEFLRGVQRHRAIDSFTDAHVVVRRSRARVDASRRRFSGVLVDIFYDHLLATSWNRYSHVPLEHFTTQFYADAKTTRLPLPDNAQTMLGRIVRHRLLDSYMEVEGVHQSLRRLSMRLAARWKKPFALEAGVEDLIAHQAAFAADFDEFFPQLIQHAAANPDARVPQPVV
jgi:acyl carrier protein phosphodiesterase